MKTDMVMPQMGESIAEGTIVKWRKRVGESVEKDEMILDISTDKVDSEIPAPVSGTLAEIVTPEGETVEVGAVIARIETTDSQSSAAQTDDKAATALKESSQALPESDSKATRPIQMERSSDEPKRFLSPVVRKMAHEHGLNRETLLQIRGSGAHGRITKKDVLAFLEQGRAEAAERPSPKQSTPQPETRPKAVPAATAVTSHPSVPKDEDVQVEEMDHVRKRIADHMVLSKKTSPHVTSVAEVDVTPLVNYREQKKSEFERKEGVKLTYTAFFIKAVSPALKEFPLLNSSVDGDRIVKRKSINIGVAVGIDKGLIVPVLHHADQLNVVGIARRLTDLASRARSKQLKPDDVQGGTFSITNIGTFGNLFGTPIINQPQVAILGTGAIKKRPVVIDDMIAIRSMMYISLTYDHRIIDGLYAGSFLQRVIQILESDDPVQY